jgi:hypothetical protein
MLQIAEKLIEEAGDIYWFRQHYSLLREHNGILDSLEIALKAQNLWARFIEQTAGDQ